jgi:rRNA processing protein Krr1/Pno1
MPFYKDHAYPDLVSVLGNPKPIEEIRQRIVPLAQGKKRNLVVGIHIGVITNTVRCRLSGRINSQSGGRKCK